MSDLAWLLMMMVIALAVFMPVKVANANGIHATPVEVYSGVVGQYRIRVEATQTVGNVHITVHLAGAFTEIPVSDAIVKIRGRRLSDGEGIRPAIGIYSPGPKAYTLSVFVPEPGDWMFTIDVSGQGGHEIVEVTIWVAGTSGASWTAIAGVAVLLVLAFWFSIRALQQNILSGRGKRRT